MPATTVTKFLVDQSNDAYLQSSPIPIASTTWPLGSKTCWAVTIKPGQSAPPAGYIATYDDQTAPWNGVNYFTEPAPSYPPLGTLRSEATDAINAWADQLFSDRNGGNPRLAQANLEALFTLRAKQAAGTLAGDEVTQLASLEDVAARNAATNDRVTTLHAWVASETSQAVLDAFLKDVGAPPDGLGWPA